MVGEAAGAGKTLLELGDNLREIVLLMPSSLGHLSRLCWPFVNCEDTRNFSKPPRGKRSGRQRDVLPLPLSIPSAEDTGIKAACGHCVRKVKRVTTWLLLLVLVLNFEYNLKRPEIDVSFLHGPATVAQEACLTRLFWAAWRLDRDDSEPLPQLDWRVELASKCLSYSGEEVGVAQRVTLEQLLPALPRPGMAGTISAVDAAEGEVKACLLDPGRVELTDAEKTERSPYTAAIWCDYDEWVRIALALVELGVCGTLREADLWIRRGRAVVNGLFGVGKSKADDVETPYGLLPVLRLIMNLVPSNAWQRMITGDLNEMALAMIWQQLILLETEIILWSASDRRCFFYIFFLPPVWYKMMVFSAPLPGELFGWEAGSWAYICSRVVAMGWLSAVGVCQHLHRNMVRRGTALPRGLPRERELRRDRPLPWTENTSSRHVWQIFVDNQDNLEIVDADDGGELEGSMSGYMRIAEDCYQDWGSEGNPKELTLRQTEVESLGTRVLGREGRLLAPKRFTTALIELTLWYISLPSAPLKIGLVVAGRWVRKMLWRRPCMCLFDHTWKWLSRGFTGGPVPLPVVQELLAAVVMAPLMYTDLRLRLDSDIFCSDASLRGGAVCIGREMTPAGHAALDRFNTERDLGNASEHLLLVSLFDGIGGARRTVESMRVTPAAYVAAEVDTGARRVVRSCWPSVEELGDVTSVSRGQLLKVRDQCPRLTRGLLIAGLPSLHVELLDERGVGRGRVTTLEALRRMHRLLLEVFDLLEWTVVLEYDGHAEVKELEAIIKTFEVHIVWFCASAVTWVRRPCWYLVSDDVFAALRDRLRPVDNYHVLIADQVLTSPVDWLDEGCLWNEAMNDLRLPTAARRITRTKPPRCTAALASSTAAETAAWAKDEWSLPLHHYWKEFQVLGKDGAPRSLTAEEHERLHGFATGHTITVVSSSYAKQNKRDTAARRSALLAVTFNCVALSEVLRPWAQQCAYVCDDEPLVNNEVPRGFNRKQALLLHLWRGTSHRGSDVRLTSGEPMKPGAWPRQAVNPDWWSWQNILLTKWKSTAHINELECRAALLTLQWRCRSINRLACRWLTLLDSFVAIAVLTKRRSSSYVLNRVIRRFAVLELATFSMSAFGFARSHLNPADKGSRL